jgi:hypothetical protein
VRHDRLNDLVLAVTVDEVNLIGLKFPAHELTVHQSAYKKVFTGLKHPRNGKLHLLFRHLLNLCPIGRYLECSDGVVHAGRENIGLSLDVHEVYIINWPIMDFLTKYHAVSKHDHKS